jgi:hypothetical protein
VADAQLVSADGDDRPRITIAALTDNTKAPGADRRDGLELVGDVCGEHHGRQTNPLNFDGRIFVIRLKGIPSAKRRSDQKLSQE